jgi:hypothetical protein
MSEPATPGPQDSLDRIELVMAMEELLEDSRLTHAERDRLIHEIARMEGGEFGDEGDPDDDLLAALVRKLGPRGPRGQSAAAVLPPEPWEEAQPEESRPELQQPGQP